jgi:hypothetical protein
LLITLQILPKHAFEKSSWYLQMQGISCELSFSTYKQVSIFFLQDLLGQQGIMLDIYICWD